MLRQDIKKSNWARTSSGCVESWGAAMRINMVDDLARAYFLAIGPCTAGGGPEFILAC